MRILFLAHRIPYPPNKGDKIRSFHEVQFLSKKHEVHLTCLADNPDDLKYVDKLKSYCKSVNVVAINRTIAKLKSLYALLSSRPLSVPYFYSPELQGIINNLLSTYVFDVIFCFSSPVAEYIFRSDYYQKVINSTEIQANRNRIEPCFSKLIMDFVDVDSDKWLQYSKYTGFPFSWLYRLESARLAKYENRIAEFFDHSIFVSQNEAALFKKLNPHIDNITVISNGVDSDFFSFEERNNLKSKEQSNNKRPVLVFTGAMDYYANVDGVIWFIREIFPKIKERFPEAQFYIVGSRPDKKIQKLKQSEGIHVTGFVEDVREYYKMADLCVIPLRIARGIQNKILEAMSCGVPVVSTPEAFAGITAVSGLDMEVASNSTEFIDKSIQILEDESMRRSMSKRGREFVTSNYQWSENIKELESLIKDA